MTYANKKLSELTLDECKELIQHDDGMQEYCYSCLLDDANFWFNKITRNAPRDFVAEYNGYYERVSIDFRCFENCRDWLEEIQRTYCIFSDTVFNTLEKAVRISERKNYCDSYVYLSEANEERLYARYEELIQPFIDELSDYFSADISNASDENSQAEILYENAETLEEYGAYINPVDGCVYQPQKDKRFCGCW